jgi:hypothetical protein
MAEVYVPSFGVKDPDEVWPKNFDAAGKLAAIPGAIVSSYTVFVDATKGCADGALVISDITFNATTKRVSFTWSGGTPGETYWLTFRCSGTVPRTFSFDQSATVLIGHK